MSFFKNIFGGPAPPKKEEGVPPIQTQAQPLPPQQVVTTPKQPMKSSGYNPPDLFQGMDLKASTTRPKRGAAQHSASGLSQSEYPGIQTSATDFSSNPYAQKHPGIPNNFGSSSTIPTTVPAHLHAGVAVQNPPHAAPVHSSSFGFIKSTPALNQSSYNAPSQYFSNEDGSLSRNSTNTSGVYDENPANIGKNRGQEGYVIPANTGKGYDNDMIVSPSMDMSYSPINISRTSNEGGEEEKSRSEISIGENTSDIPQYQQQSTGSARGATIQNKSDEKVWKKDGKTADAEEIRQLEKSFEILDDKKINQAYNTRFENAYHKKETLDKNKEVKVPEPKKIEKPEDKAESIKKEIIKAKERVIEITVEQNKIMKGKDKLEAELKVVRENLARANEEQSVAAQREDFDEADKINVVITQYTANEQYLLDDIKQKKEDYSMYESQKSVQHKNLSSSIHSYLDDIAKKKELEEKEYNEYEATELEKIKDTEEWIEEKQENLKQVTEEIENAERDLKEKSYQLEFKIESGCKELFNIKEMHEDTLQKLTKEIEELEKLLETKKKAKKETKEAYESTVREITHIRDSFKPEYESIEEDKEGIEFQRKAFEKNTNELEEEKVNHEQYRKKVFERIEEYKRKIKLFTEISKEFQEGVDVIDSKTQEKDSWSIKEHNLGNEIYKASIKLGNVDKKIEFGRRKIGNTETKKIDNESKKASNLNKVQALEQEKKTFAQNRQFKEAKKAADDIKDLVTQNQQLDEENVVLSNEMAASLEDLQKLEKEKKAILNEKQSYEVEMESARYELFKFRVQEIEEMLKSIQEDQFKKLSKHVDVLEEELLLCKFEIDKYESKNKIKKTDAPLKDTNAKAPVEEPTPVQAPKNEITEIEEEIKEEHKETNVIIQDEGKQDMEVDYEQLKTAVKVLKKEIKELEALIEKAVEEDDYERADENDQKLKTKQVELEKYIEVLGKVQMELEDDEEVRDAKKREEDLPQIETHKDMPVIQNKVEEVPTPVEEIKKAEEPLTDKEESNVQTETEALPTLTTEVSGNLEPSMEHSLEPVNQEEQPKEEKKEDTAVNSEVPINEGTKITEEPASTNVESSTISADAKVETNLNSNVEVSKLPESVEEAKLPEKIEEKKEDLISPTLSDSLFGGMAVKPKARRQKKETNPNE